MFGYQVIDLILFDFETLVSLYKGYIFQYPYFIYPFLFLNGLAPVLFYLKMKPLFYGLLSLCWSLTGYLFLFKEFSSIYWPAEYMAYFFYFMSILLGLNSYISFKIKVRQNQFSQWVLFLILLLPVIFYLLNYLRIPFVLGLDPITVALASLFGSANSYLSWLIKGLSLFWLSLASYFLFVLYFYV